MPEGIIEEQQPRELPEWTKDEQFDALIELIAPPDNGLTKTFASGYARKELAATLVDLGESIQSVIQETGATKPNDRIGFITQTGLRRITGSPLTNTEKLLVVYTACNTLLGLDTGDNTGLRLSIGRQTGILLFGQYSFGNTARYRDTDEDRVRAIERVTQIVIGKYDKGAPTDTTLKEITDTILRNDKPKAKTILAASRKTLEIARKRDTYPRAEYDPAVRPDAIKSHEYRTSRLRMPFMKEFFTVVSRVRQFQNEIHDIFDRRGDYMKKLQKKGETHRILTTILSAIYQSPRFSWLLDKTIDRAVDAESARIESLIRAGYNTVDTLVVGSGLHGSVLANELRHLLPDADMLFVDAGERLGGQFAEAETDVYYTNSRIRPEDPDERGVPGEKGNLNSLGPHAVLQASDITSETYGPQTTFARPIRSNALLSAPTLIRTDVTSLVKLPDSAQKILGARYAVTMTIRNSRGSREVTLFVNRVINTSGLGEEAFPGLDTASPPIARILEDARSDLARGITPKVLHSSWFWRTVGNGANEFPRKDFTGDVLVIGDGDSAYTVFENLLGYGPKGTHASVHQLDWPQNLTWVGQDATNKEELLEGLRVRYGRVALDMPRTNYSYSRIDPEPGRAFNMFEQEGKIVVEWNDGDTVTRKAFDRVVFATGYQDRSNQIISSDLFKKLTVGQNELYDLDNNLRPEFLVPEAVFESELGIVKDRIVSVNSRTVRIARSVIDREETMLNRPRALFLADRFAKVTLPSPTFISATSPVFSELNIVARQIPGEQIYYGGTSARIPVQTSDGINRSFFEIIPENTAAAFLTVPRTVKLAPIIAGAIKSDAQKDTTIPTERSLNRALRTMPKPSVSLPALSFWKRISPIRQPSTISREIFYSQPSPNGSLRDERVVAKLPRQLDVDDWLRITTGATIANFRFPPRKKPYKFHLKRELQVIIGETFFKPLTISSDDPIDTQDPRWEQFGRALGTNGDFLALVEKQTKQPRKRRVNPKSINTNADTPFIASQQDEAILSIPVDTNGTPIISEIRLERA